MWLANKHVGVFGSVITCIVICCCCFLQWLIITSVLQLWKSVIWWEFFGEGPTDCSTSEQDGGVFLSFNSAEWRWGILMISRRLFLPVVSWVTAQDTTDWPLTCKHQAASPSTSHLSFLQDCKRYFTRTWAIKLFKLEARVVIGPVQLWATL